MSTREQRLLFLFLGAIVVIGGLFGYRWVKALREEVADEIREAETTIEVGQLAEEQWQSVQREVEWLDEYEPEPKVGELVPPQLETFTTNEARRAGLTINRPKILENETSGPYYHRARFQISVSGMENALYNWLCRVQSPRDFRAVTELRLSPNREDDTKIDATVQIEQWFVPATGGEGEVGAAPVSPEPSVPVGVEPEIPTNSNESN